MEPLSRFEQITSRSILTAKRRCITITSKSRIQRSRRGELDGNLCQICSPCTTYEEFRSIRNRLATDYAETLITAGEPDLGLTNVKEYRLKYHENGQPPRPNAKASRVVISLTGVVPTPEMMRYLDSTPADSTDLKNRLTTIQALNIVINETPNKDTTVCQAGRNVFAEFPRNRDPRTMIAYQNIDLSHGLIGVRSYYSSTKTSTARLLLNLHGQCSPFYPELNLLTLIEDFTRGCNDLYRLERFIQGLRVRFSCPKTEEKMSSRL